MDQIRWLEIIYVSSGALIGWLLSISKDFLNRRRERKEVLIRFHKEIQYYRNNFNQPGINNKTNTINIWPEISSTFVRIIVQSSVISVKKNSELFSKSIDLIRDIEFYHRVMESAYMGFVTRFSTQSDVYNALLPALIKIRITLQDLDIILSRVTKISQLEISFDNELVSNIEKEENI